MPNLFKLFSQIVKLMMFGVNRLWLLFLLVFSQLALAACPVGTPPGVTCIDINAPQVLQDQTCITPRSGSLNCTANDFTVGATFSAADGTPPVCVAGSVFNFLVRLDLTSKTTDRYDVGFFVGQNGVSPEDSLGNTCTVATFPTTPSPWYNDSGSNNACGDYLKGSLRSITTINQIKVNCQGDSVGYLQVPSLHS